VKVTHIGPEEIFHRYLTPKWAFLPTSGAGAAIDGARFNRPGVEAQYLSRASDGAGGIQTGRQHHPPATLAAYKITLAELGDSRRDSARTFGTAPGRNGIVPGAESLASTRKSRHRGSSRTFSGTQHAAHPRP